MDSPEIIARQFHPLLIFLHLPKTAGSTMDLILERQYGRNGIVKLFDSFFGEELATWPQNRFEQVRVITGHFSFGVHDYLPGPASYFTILRDPVERVISHYYYVRRNPHHYLFPLAQKVSLQDYVIACRDVEPNNDQTRLLAGKDLLRSDGKCRPEMLPVAQENLCKHFHIIGLTEDFDRSLILMKKAFGWHNPYYRRQNVSRDRSRKTELPLEALTTIQKYNDLDIQLYEYARICFQSLLKKQGEFFECEVALFQKLNSMYAKWYRWMELARGQNKMIVRGEK